MSTTGSISISVSIYPISFFNIHIGTVPGVDQDAVQCRQMINRQFHDKRRLLTSDNSFAQHPGRPQGEGPGYHPQQKHHRALRTGEKCRNQHGVNRHFSSAVHKRRNQYCDQPVFFLPQRSCRHHAGNGAAAGTQPA